MARRGVEAKIWKKVLEEAGEAEIERAASISVEQAEKELAEAGFDVAAERARAEAFLESLEGKGTPQQPQSGVRAAAGTAVEGESRRRRVPPAVWAGAAAAAAAGLAVTYPSLHEEGEKVATPLPADGAVPAAQAAELRRRAAVECEAGRAKECLQLLDSAREIDAAGDDAESVRKLRARAAGQTGAGER